MKKHSEIFLANYLYPVFVAVTIAALSLLYSKVTTGNWLDFIQRLPSTVLYVVGVLLVLWISSTLVVRRRRSVRDPNSTIAPMVLPHSPFGWTEAFEFSFKGVLWPVSYPTPPPWLSSGSLPSPSRVDIDIPPRCPKCKTEIEERKSFWSGYLWTCPGCDFKKRNRDSFYVERDRAEKVVRANYREGLKLHNAGG